MLRENYESKLSRLTAYENLHRCQDQSTMQPLLTGTMPIQSFELSAHVESATYVYLDRLNFQQE